MKVKEDPLVAGLQAELAELRSQVQDLRGRVRGLESDAQAAPPPPAEEREGDFGPAIKRSAPSRHQSAVNRALTMIGVLPEQAETTRSEGQNASHEKALERMRNMGSSTDVTPSADKTPPEESKQPQRSEQAPSTV